MDNKLTCPYKDAEEGWCKLSIDWTNMPSPKCCDGERRDCSAFNRVLIQKYPFLLPHNRWTDEVTDAYDYGYTELDAIPEGWYKAFGLQMIDEINAALKSSLTSETIQQFRIMQIKEKFGYLHLYTNWCTTELNNVLNKYADLSKRTCIRCGKPATKISTGWISPWCDDCAIENDNYMSVDEFYNEIEGDGGEC